MDPTNIISLVANLGFPVIVSFILLRYVLETVGEKFEHLEQILNKLTDTIEKLNSPKK